MAVHTAKGRAAVGGFLRAKLAASPLAARTFATLASPLVAGGALFLLGGASTLGSLCSPASLEIFRHGVFGGDISSASWESFTLDLGLTFDFALPAAFVLLELLDLGAAFGLFLPLGLDAAAFACAFAFALGVSLARLPLPFGLPGFLPLPLPLLGFLSSASGSWGALVANCSILDTGSCRDGGLVERDWYRGNKLKVKLVLEHFRNLRVCGCYIIYIITCIVYIIGCVGVKNVYIYIYI